ncbi:hypothetical protein GCM10010267_22770 [Streptomyces griseorubens]|nr:hypothetical protein GCM10010267_22770 [Streptomyces griseorubens]
MPAVGGTDGRLPALAHAGGGEVAHATGVGVAAYGGEGTGWGWAPAAAGASAPSATRDALSRQTEDDHPHRGPATTHHP